MPNNPPFLNILQSLIVGPRNSQLSIAFDIKILPPNAVEYQPFYGIWLLDVSGSMMDHKKLISARESLIQQVNTLPNGTIFTLITFGPVKVRVENETIGLETRTYIKETIDKVKVWGSTPMEEALDKAIEILKKYNGPITTRKIILISDGQPDGGCSDKEPEEKNFQKFMRFPALALEYKASIDTVGALFGHNVLLMYELARRSTGKYIFANNEQELKEKMTIASVQATQILYSLPSLTIMPLLGTCQIQDAVQFKPTIVRMPFEHIGNNWKCFLRSFEAGDSYQILLKMEYNINEQYTRVNNPLKILNFEFDFGDPTLTANKEIEIRFTEDPNDFKLNQQIIKQYTAVFTQAQEINDATRMGDPDKTQRIQGDETRKVKN